MFSDTYGYSADLCNLYLSAIQQLGYYSNYSHAK